MELSDKIINSKNLAKNALGTIADVLSSSPARTVYGSLMIFQAAYYFHMMTDMNSDVPLDAKNQLSGAAIYVCGLGLLGVPILKEGVMDSYNDISRLISKYRNIKK